VFLLTPSTWFAFESLTIYYPYKNSQKMSKKVLVKICPETGEKVSIVTLTLADYKNVQKTGEVPKSNFKKQLLRVPSKQIREECYLEAAGAIQAREEQILPTYGGRPWKISCRLIEPRTPQKPPLFRFYRAQLELAVMPHLLAQVPEPLETKGIAKLVEDRNEGFYNSNIDLCEREESQLSRMAWNDREHQIPVMTLRWQSPNHEKFTTRKAVEEEAIKLTDQQLLIDKIIFGYGAKGQKLFPRKPTKLDALQAGKLRFLRDGLWVVGQEESWQKDRLLEIQAEANRKELHHQKNPKRSRPSPSIPKSALDLFLKTQRIAYRNMVIEKLSKILDKPLFTLSDSERELRLIWKTEITKEEKQPWCDLLKKGDSNLNLETKTIYHDAPGNLNDDATEFSHADVQNTISLDCSFIETMNKQIDSNNEGDRSLDANVADQRQECLGERVEDKSSSYNSDSETKAVGESSSTFLNSVTISPGDSEGESETFGESVTSTVKVDDTCDVSIHVDDSQAMLTSVVVSPAAIDTTSNLRRSNRPRKAKVWTDIEIQPFIKVDMKKDHVPSVWAAIPDVVKLSSKTIIGEGALPGMDSDTRETTTYPRESVAKRKRNILLSFSESSRWRLSREQIRMCYDAAVEHFEKVMYTVKARALFSELSDGFDLLRERGRGRYDMELPVFDESKFSFLTDLTQTPWIEVVQQILGDEVVLIHKGVFLSNPGSETQGYHQDGPHISMHQQRPCHAINVFIPLIDLTLRNGPTEFVLGSHFLDYEGYDKNKVLIPQVTAGTPIIFDYRLGHRGLANTSDECRPIVYCTYAATSNGKEFRDSVNFSRKRYHRLGTLVEMPLPRGERHRIRVAQQEDRSNVLAIEEIDHSHTICSGSDCSKV
jgi:Phytanoyl-CoA dioxygenase (PhyH)